MTNVDVLKKVVGTSLLLFIFGSSFDFLNTGVSSSVFAIVFLAMTVCFTILWAELEAYANYETSTYNISEGNLEGPVHLDLIIKQKQEACGGAEGRLREAGAQPKILAFECKIGLL